MPTYPRDFFEEWEGEVDHGLCFGIMPFDGALRPVWDTIKAVAQGDPFNLQCVRADDVARPGCIMEDVLEYIAEAELVIADLTGRNPNVFYELGIAHSRKPSKNVLLLAQHIDEVPFDLRHLRCLIYEPDLSDLERSLFEALQQGALRRYCVEVGEGQRARFPGRITGRDRCLYEFEIRGDYLGADGIKFRLTTTRLVAGREPEVGDPVGHYLGADHPLIDLPRTDWALRYGGGSQEAATIFLVKSE